MSNELGRDPVDLYLVRHGQTEWNAERRLQGQLDSPLTSEGKAQARWVGIRLARLGVERLVGSDLGRTRQTAACIAEELGGVEYELQPGFRERNLGALQGLCVGEFNAAQAEQYEACRYGGPTFAPPSGESRMQLVERGVVALQQLAESASPGQRIGVISHGGLLGAVLGQLLGVPMTVRRSFYVANCALHHIQWRENQFEVVTLGEKRHLVE